MSKNMEVNAVGNGDFSMFFNIFVGLLSRIFGIFEDFSFLVSVFFFPFTLRFRSGNCCRIALT